MIFARIYMCIFVMYLIYIYFLSKSKSRKCVILFDRVNASDSETFLRCNFEKLIKKVLRFYCILNILRENSEVRFAR